MTELVSRESIQETLQLGEVLAKSGFFADARSAAQAVVKVLAGRELGFPTIASMTGIHIIDGKPSIGAHLMAAAIKRSGRYDYRVLRCDKEVCEIEFFALQQGGRESLGTVSMTLQQAVDTGLALGRDGRPKANWARSADDMLFARCISKGYRRYCPDLTGGVSVYDPDELDNVQAITVVESPPQLLPPEIMTASLPEPQAALVEIPATPPDRITEEQEREIKEMIEKTGTDIKALLAHYKVPVLAKLTQANYVEVRDRLTARLAASIPTQQPTAQPASVSREDVPKIDEVYARIDGLVEELQISPEQWQTRLKQLFGHANALQLGLQQLEQLERRLLDYKAKRGAA